MKPVRILFLLSAAGAAIVAACGSSSSSPGKTLCTGSAQPSTCGAVTRPTRCGDAPDLSCSCPSTCAAGDACVDSYCRPKANVAACPSDAPCGISCDTFLRYKDADCRCDCPSGSLCSASTCVTSDAGADASVDGCPPGSSRPDLLSIYPNPAKAASGSLIVVSVRGADAQQNANHVLIGTADAQVTHIETDALNADQKKIYAKVPVGVPVGAQEVRFKTCLTATQSFPIQIVAGVGPSINSITRTDGSTNFQIGGADFQNFSSVVFLNASGTTAINSGQGATSSSSISISIDPTSLPNGTYWVSVLTSDRGLGGGPPHTYTKP